MSTHQTFKHGLVYHLYTDMLDEEPRPLYLALNCDFEAWRDGDRAGITVTIPHDIAVELGLIERAIPSIHIPETIDQIQIGTVIRNRGSGTAYVVVDRDADRVTAVRLTDVSNPSEWEIVRP